MADIKWSVFPNVGTITSGDELVGLRAGANVQFNAPIYGSQIVVVTTATQAMASNTIYIANCLTSLVTFTLPTASAVGDRLFVIGQSTGLWTITENAGQLMNMGNISTTTTTGSLSSTFRYDVTELICLVANTTWNVIDSIGNITVV
jgi:hypothetical protein